MSGKNVRPEPAADATKSSVPLWNPLLFSRHPETKNA